MKLTRYALQLIVLLCGGAGVLFGQAPGDYRSFQSGNWTATGSWERFDGSIWVNPAPTAPASTDGVITILGGDTITVDAGVAADQVVVDAGGNLTVGAGNTLTAADGADSIDLAVYGTLNMFGVVTATGRVSIESGGLYTYSVPAGGSTMPLCTWRTGSTCRIDSTTGTTPTNLNLQALHHLVWNGTNTGANGGPNFSDGAVIGGDVTVLSSKSFQWRIANFSGGQVKNVRILGNLNIAGATAVVTGTGSGADTLARLILTIDGDVNLTAGTWNLCNSSNVYTEWHIKGNVTVSGGTLLASGSSGWPGRRLLDFSGGATQSFTVSSPGTIGTATAMFRVSNGSAVQVNFPWTLVSTSMMNLVSGKFVTTSTNLLTIPAGGTILGGGPAAFVDGPLAMVIASTSPTSKTFPLGKGTTSRPVTLTVNHDAATATTYTAELFNTVPPARTLPAELIAVSSVRYYSIVKGTGAGISPTLGATVQLAYDADDQVDSAAILRVAKDDGAGNWVNLGGSGTADTVGSITSNAFMNFSDFVLATADTTTPAVSPTVTTTAVSYISTTFATSGGNVTNDGGAPVTARGVCWNTTGTPTVGDDTTSDGTGAGVFTSALTGLSPGLTYHLRAYATNAAGTGYGDEVVFSTLATIVPPTVTTTAVSAILVTTAVGGGTVTDWGGDPVTARGVCWNTTGSPTVADPHSVDGPGLGAYASGLAPLVGNTTYYVRAYAGNGAGTGYGSELSFTTQTPLPDTTVVVAQNGSGDYLTVQAAFNAVPPAYTGKWTIFVKNGVYYEKLLLASNRSNVVLIGEHRDSTILTYDDYADRYGPGNPGTSGSYSVGIDASDFTAKNITFRNTYAPQVGVVGTQAVALRTQGDRHEFVNCNILGYQDTYYTWGGSGTGRSYHRNCLIRGTVDFIFGRNIAVFDSCTIHEIRNTATITAGATDATSQFGYVFRNCTILADSLGYDGVPITSFFLGRPWQASPRTVFLNSFEPAGLNPAGWQSWNVPPAIYGEFNCFGPGSATGGRVPWSTQLSGPAASGYALSNIFARTAAASPLILYDWMPANAMSDLPLLMRIDASSGSNGSIAPAGTTNVAYGGSAAYAMTPDPGYQVADVLVDGGSIGAVTSYPFTSVTTNRSISVTFAPVPMNNVLFRVNMRAKALAGLFDPTVDAVTVRGSFNDWGNSTNNPDTLTDGDNDSIYVKTIALLPNTSYQYKFWKTLRGGMEWEDGVSPNRQVDLGTADTTLPAPYFNNDGPDVGVTFQVNMSIKMLEGTFLPGSGDQVSVNGNFNGWSPSVAFTDGDADSIYTATLQVPSGQTIAYKFFKTLRGGLNWEADPNREYIIPLETPVVVPPDYFDRDSVYTAPPVSPKFLTVTPETIIAKDPVKGKFWKPVKRFKGLNPNWANLLDETVAQGGFQPGASESDSAGGMVIGTSWMFRNSPDPLNPKWKPVKDSAAVHAWVRLTKWDFKKTMGKGFNALQKTLEDKTGAHDLLPARGFDYTTDGKNKPLVKQMTKLVPKKQDNALFAELVAFKLNIAASELGKTPEGLGDLVYDNDSSMFDEEELAEMADAIDTMMTFWQLSDSSAFADAYATLYSINRAFAGPFDTASFNEEGLVLNGAVELSGVPFLKAPVPFIATRLAPTTTEVESGEEIDFEDEEFEEGSVPVAAKLYQNYPNPFNPGTTIGFRLLESSQVTIRIYDMLGQEIATLLTAGEMEEGYNEIRFNAGDLSSGVYFYRIDVQGLEDAGLHSVVTNKMLLLK